MPTTEPSASQPAHRPDRAARFLYVWLLPAFVISWLILSSCLSVKKVIGQMAVGLSDGAGHPLGDCFINFWSAAKLATLGRMADIYNWDAFHAFQQSTVGADLIYYHYSYPPVMPLLTLPLAWLPYAPAFGVWAAGTWGMFYAALRAARPPVSALVLSLVPPALLFNALAGQNGALTAALLGGGLAVLPRRPVLAGILFGLLCFKPQLAFLIPVALICGGYFRTLLVAGITAAIVCGLSVVLYGLGPWQQYMHTAQMLRHYVLEDDTPHSWQQFVSVFVMARQAGASIAAAYAVQGMCAAVALFATVKLWRGKASHDVRCAALVLGTFVATPYVMKYDLVVMTFVAVWLRRSYRHYKGAAALLLAAPVLSSLTGVYLGISTGPALLLPAFLLVLSSCGLPWPKPQELATPPANDEPI